MRIVFEVNASEEDASIKYTMRQQMELLEQVAKLRRAPQEVMFGRSSP